jgi:hypothetical protein
MNPLWVVQAPTLRELQRLCPLSGAIAVVPMLATPTPRTLPPETGHKVDKQLPGLSSQPLTWYAAMPPPVDRSTAAPDGESIETADFDKSQNEAATWCRKAQQF